MNDPVSPAVRLPLCRLALALALSLIAATPVALLPTAASAQAAAAEFRISAGPLAQALQQFGRQSGLTLSYSAADIDGKRSPGANGSQRPEDALAALLAGTGLSVQRLPNGSYVLRQAPAAGISTLPAIQVSGDMLSDPAWGPVDGFVAGRSLTATKTDTPLIETPQSISVVTRDQMAWQGVQKTEQALRYEAGVRAETADDLRHQNIWIRGFSAAASNQGIYLDGLPLATRYYGSYDVNPYALERIEVLRGPASPLYGQNQPGGIVNQVSKRPTDTPLREIVFTTGDPGRAQLGFDFGGPADAHGQWLYRLTGEGRNADTEVHTVRDKRAFIAPSVTWQPSAASRLTLLTNFQRIRAGSTDQWLPAVGTLSPTPYGRIPRDFFSGEPDYDRYDKDQAMLGYLFEHRFNDSWTLRQNGRYNQNRTHYRALISELGWGALPDGQPDYRSLQRYAFSSEEKARTVAVDTHLQYQGRTGGFAHTVLMGVDYQQSSFDTQLGFGTDGVPPIDPFDPVYGYGVEDPPIYNDTDQRMRQLGLYAQDQVKILDKVVVTAGGRLDWSDVHTRNRLADQRSKQNDHAFTGRIGMVYLSDSGLAPYASYSTSFRPQLGTTFDGTPFKPTKGEQYEAGVKFQPKGYDSFITASVFQIEQRNVLTRDPDHPTAQVQTGKIRSEGFELQGKASLSGNFDIVASYTYTDIKTVSSNYPEQVDKVPFAGIPRHMASLWADYTLQAGPLAGLGFGAGVRYIGTTFSDLDNAVKVPAVTLADAAIRYDLGRASSTLKGASLSLNVSNLSDKEYVASCNNVNLCFYGPGRVVLATMRYAW